MTYGRRCAIIFEYNLANKKAAKALQSLLGKYKPQYVLETLPVPGHDEHPVSKKVIHQYVTGELAKGFTLTPQPPGAPPDMVHGGLRWKEARRWDDFKRTYPQYMQHPCLHTAWEAITDVPKHDLVHAALTDIFASPLPREVHNHY